MAMQCGQKTYLNERKNTWLSLERQFANGQAGLYAYLL